MGTQMSSQALAMSPFQHVDAFLSSLAALIPLEGHACSSSWLLGITVLEDGKVCVGAKSQRYSRPLSPLTPSHLFGYLPLWFLSVR